VDLGFGSSVYLLQRSICGSRPACLMRIYSREVYVNLGFGSSVDLLQGSVCGFRFR